MPKIVDHNEYRKNLLGRAFDLFAQKGFAAVTMREIAQGLGVSTGTLYHYFPSKEALFEQLMHEKADYYVLMLTRELEGTKTLTEQVDALGRFLQKNEDSLIKEIYISVDFVGTMAVKLFKTIEPISSPMNALNKPLQTSMEFPVQRFNISSKTCLWG